MLPSFRLIVLTFVLSFVVISGALRLIAPPRAEAFAQASPIEAAPLERGGVGALEWRQAEATVPVIFDLRFTASDPVAVPASLTLYAIDRAARTAPEPQATPESPADMGLPMPDLVSNPLQAPPAAILSVPAIEDRPLVRNAPVQITPPTLPAAIPESAILSPLSMLSQESAPMPLSLLSTTGAAPFRSRSAPAAEIAPVVTPPTVIAALPAAQDPLPESDTMDEDDDATASVASTDTPAAVVGPAAEPRRALPLSRPQLRSTVQPKRAVKPTAKAVVKNSKRQAKSAPPRKPVVQRPARVVRARAVRAKPSPTVARVAQPASVSTPPRFNGNPFATLFGSGAQ